MPLHKKNPIVFNASVCCLPLCTGTGVCPGGRTIGTTVSGEVKEFREFVGKPVYVDVWATWCVPCIKEIPALKQLEADLHDLDIIFLSYSIDDVSSRSKWEKFVEDEQLSGVQLMGGEMRDLLVNTYKINSIPRFLLFDKEGKIVDINAPRPSDPKIREILKRLAK